jgi:hypothetical protein
VNTEVPHLYAGAQNIQIDVQTESEKHAYNKFNVKTTSNNRYQRNRETKDCSGEGFTTVNQQHSTGAKQKHKI